MGYVSKTIRSKIIPSTNFLREILLFQIILIKPRTLLRGNLMIDESVNLLTISFGKTFSETWEGTLSFIFNAYI